MLITGHVSIGNEDGECELYVHTFTSVEEAIAKERWLWFNVGEQHYWVYKGVKLGCIPMDCEDCEVWLNEKIMEVDFGQMGSR